MQNSLQALMDQVQSVVLGKESAVRRVLVAILSRGHVLLEDVPGVGKTLLARVLAASVDASFCRIQMTPDLLPSDILGVSVFSADTQQFHFKPGPIFTQFLLADEINRTTPRTQSALLEAMSEVQVTADGQTYPLGPVFMVIATQNPYEFEGTYCLPENQLDRFMMRIRMGHPDKSTEREILLRQPERSLDGLQPVMTVDELVTLQDAVDAIRCDDAIIDYIVNIAEATRRSDDLAVGLSSRGSLGLLQAGRASAMLDGREYVTPEDVRQLASCTCAHRLVARSFEQHTHSTASEAVFDRILETIPVPQ